MSGGNVTLHPPASADAGQGQLPAHVPAARKYGCCVTLPAPDDADWTDEWKKVNPSLGITVDIEKLRVACENAKSNPGKPVPTASFESMGKATGQVEPRDKWDSCAYQISAESLRGRVCYGGLDLSSTTDITAFVLVFGLTRATNTRYFPSSGYRRIT